MIGTGRLRKLVGRPKKKLLAGERGERADLIRLSRPLFHPNPITKPKEVRVHTCRIILLQFQPVLLQGLTRILQKNNCNLAILHVRAFPVVKVVVQEAVARTELQLFKEGAVVHEVEAVDNIYADFFGVDQEIVHELREVGFGGHIVVGVGSVQILVGRMAKNGRGEVVEAAEVGDLLGLRIFDNPRVNDTSMGQKPVCNISLIKVKTKGELLQVFVEEDGHFRHITRFRLSQAWRLCLLFSINTLVRN